MEGTWSSRRTYADTGRTWKLRTERPQPAWREPLIRCYADDTLLFLPAGCEVSHRKLGAGNWFPAGGALCNRKQTFKFLDAETTFKDLHPLMNAFLVNGLVLTFCSPVPGLHSPSVLPIQHSHLDEHIRSTSGFCRRSRQGLNHQASNQQRTCSTS